MIFCIIFLAKIKKYFIQWLKVRHYISQEHQVLMYLVVGVKLSLRSCYIFVPDWLHFHFFLLPLQEANKTKNGYEKKQDKLDGS